MAEEGEQGGGVSPISVNERKRTERVEREKLERGKKGKNEEIIFFDFYSAPKMVRFSLMISRPARFTRFDPEVRVFDP